MLFRKGGEPLKKGIRFYFTLFTSTFFLSAFTFGGGYVIIPLMRKKFVEELKWIEEEEMMDLTAIAQSSPGAIAVNASILVGYRLAGIRGALLTVLGTSLPPLLILSVISLAYTAFRDSIVVNYLLKGMQAGVVAVILDVVWTMGKEILKEKKILPLVILIGSFVSAYFLGWNLIAIILFCALIGMVHTLYQERNQKNTEKREPL